MGLQALSQVYRTSFPPMLKYRVEGVAGRVEWKMSKSGVGIEPPCCDVLVGGRAEEQSGRIGLADS
jgi:hypothetical protein